jgi:hypothetical protein
MNQPLATRLVLDSAGTDGAVSEVSQPVSMEGSNAAQWEATLYSLTATNVSFQLQVSQDLENWANKGTAQTQTAVGYKLFTAETAIAAAYARLKYTITGTGKAVVAASISLSVQ